VRRREAEVRHQHRAVGLDEDVAGLQVLVDDSGLVRGVQGAGDLVHDAQGRADVERPPAEDVAEGAAVDQAHAHVRQRASRGHLVDGHDPRVVQP
jgi:hypothetical protein